MWHIRPLSISIRPEDSTKKTSITCAYLHPAGGPPHRHLQLVQHRRPLRHRRQLKLRQQPQQLLTRQHRHQHLQQRRQPQPLRQRQLRQRQPLPPHRIRRQRLLLHQRARREQRPHPDLSQRRGLVPLRHRGRSEPGERASRVLVAVSRRNELSLEIHSREKWHVRSIACLRGDACLRRETPVSPQKSVILRSMSSFQSCYQLIANISRQPRCSELREAGQRGDSRLQIEHD